MMLVSFWVYISYKEKEGFAEALPIKYEVGAEVIHKASANSYIVGFGRIMYIVQLWVAMKNNLI